MQVVDDAPFPRRGGPPAVDLVNTEVVVRGRPGDLLPDQDAIASWFAFETTRLELDGAPRLPAQAELHALRSALRRVFEAVADGAPPPAGAVAAINAAAAREQVVPELDWEGGPRLRVRAEGPADGLAAVARSAVAFLGGPDRDRLRSCGNPRCVLFFVAANRRRRWCSEACGRRVRVARHERARGRRGSRPSTTSKGTP